MIQKTIWMRYSIIGISFFSFLFFTGCLKSDIDYNVKVDFYFVNVTEELIEMKIFNSGKVLIKEYFINPIDTLSYSLSGMGGANAFNYSSDINQQGDSIYITFSDKKYLIFLKKNGYNIFWDDSYITKEISNSKREMYYFFTLDDYENARFIE